MIQVIGSQYEGFVGGKALRLVGSHRVAVVEVAGVEVVGRYGPVGSVGQTDGDGPRVRIDRRDYPSESVQQIVRPLVPQAHHAIAGSELAIASDKSVLAETPAFEHLAAGKVVEISDVVAAEGEDHDIAPETKLGRPVRDQLLLRMVGRVADVDATVLLVGGARVPTIEASSMTSTVRSSSVSMPRSRSIISLAIVRDWMCA